MSARLAPAALRLVSVVALLGLWELAARRWIDPQFASPPSRVFPAIPRLLGDPALRVAVGSFFVELAIAFALAVVLGIALGALVGATRFGRRSAFPIVLLVYAIPQVTVLPLFVLYFGLGPASKIAFGASHGIFPMILNVVGGMQSVPASYVVSARTMGASRLQLARRVVFPQLVPYLFTGMRVAMAVTLLGVMLAELYVSSTGIGYFTALYSVRFDPTDLFALIAVLALIAIVLNEAVRRLELRFARRRGE